ncbi:hypothetical protein [Leptotrichia hongkongensis]|uniref:hypothetical protein n=1 Tax=Leptotrichia hongkongensis TaxID=554406 RepID=UPI002628126D|nr:hypothetical protein [uncultured Leptotrichia sp.]
MKKILVVLMLAVGAISFSAPAQNGKKSKIDKTVNESAAQNLSFNTITLKLVGTRVSKTDKNKIELEYENFKATGNNKKVYTEKDFQVNGKNPKIIINKTISTAMIENFVNSDEEIVVTGFYENNEGIKYKPFNFSFSVNKDEVKKIYFKDGAIYIWDN